MPYRGNNYSFVIDSSFRPFTFQEMLAPYTIYKDASEKAEEAYTELKTKAGDFAYLSQTLPEGSKAREIYEGYANDLNTQAEDFAQHGLSMGNRRALTGLKQRYQGEIGRLSKADEALRKEQELRRQMGARDSSLFYAADNLSIDDFLDNNTPNLYSISGNELYAKGAAAGKAASSRIYSNPEVQKLDKYYNNYFNTVGYSPEKMQEFRDNLAAIPELQKAAMDIAEANRLGELGEGSANYQAALQQIINGIADGAVYQRQDNMQRNLDELTAAERSQRDLQIQSMNRQAAAQGLFWDDSTKSFKYDIRKDPKHSGELWKYDIKQDENGNWTAVGFSKKYEQAAAAGLVKTYDDDTNTNGSGSNGKNGGKNGKANPVDPGKLTEDYVFEKGGTVSSGVKTMPAGCKRVTIDEVRNKDPQQADQIRSTLGGDVNNYYDLWQDGSGKVYPRISNRAYKSSGTQSADSTAVPGVDVDVEQMW